MLSFDQLKTIGDSSHQKQVAALYSDLQASDPINIQYTSVRFFCMSYICLFYNKILFIKKNIGNNERVLLVCPKAQH